MAAVKLPETKSTASRLSKNAASLRNVKESTQQFRTGKSMTLDQARKVLLGDHEASSEQYSAEEMVAHPALAHR